MIFSHKRIKVGKESLSFLRPKIWVMLPDDCKDIDILLPDDCKDIDILNTFKWKVEKWKFENCPCIHVDPIETSQLSNQLIP